ncbi:S9 family peptidase [Peristeroidobacter soli]|uniref:S9 family peptidase n=1 Tax=Peristeroidobacter soli TaxID=2497877 RepID=UPI00101BA9D3|nr:DPP IV N-terminal domain-containing protein [Peristeroidobacter soli]
MRNVSKALVALAFVNCVPAAAVTHEDYVQAEALLSDRIGALVLNERVVPHWLPGRDEFWYRRETATGQEFVIVDAANGRKRPAFEHRALANALSEASGKPVDAKKLPVAGIDAAGQWTQSKLRASIEGKDYVCTLSPAACTLATKTTAGMIVSPDGKWAAFTRDGNLWLRDVINGQERALTDDGEANFGYGITPDGWKAAFVPRLRSGVSPPPLESYWSPDSRRFIVSRVDQRHVAAYPFLESAPADGSFRPKVHQVRIPLVGERPATLEWFVFDVASGEHRRIEYPYDKLLVLQQDLLAIRKTWWSPDNQRLLAVAFGDNMESAYFFDADLKTGAVRTVIEERGEPRVDLNSTSYNPPNVRATADGREVIWFSQRDGWGHLYLYDALTGTLKNRITQGDWLVRDVVHVDERRRRIYFTAGGREPGNPYYRYLYRVNFDGSDLKLLTPEPGDHLITSPWNDVLSIDGAVGYDVISPSGKFAVYNSSPIDGVTQTLIRRTDDAARVAVVETADATQLFAAGFRAPEEFVVKAADGKSDLYGVMYKPADFDPNRKYAVIDTQYASPLTAVVPRSFTQALQGPPGIASAAAFARLGFIAVVIDARGTAYRSREFSQAGFGKLNINGLDDHVAALQQLAQRFAYIDAQRVGITGASYGGWSSLRGMLEFPDFYKVGVAGVPPGSMHDMYLDYHWTTFQGRPVYSDGSELRPSPTEVPRNWTAADGRQQAARLRGKLLMIMGELDENVVPGSTLQLVDALIAANRDFELLYLPNRNHANSRNPYSIRRTWDFFVRHLLGQEPPSPVPAAEPAS